MKEGKECEKEVRVWDSVRHAQAQGLARRIQRAAELRTRHRFFVENLTRVRSLDTCSKS